MGKTALYGAILGDIIGSPFEFDRSVDGVRKSKNFELFSSKSEFTDDTVMTVAVAEALLEVGRNADEENACSAAVIKSMRKWGRKYPYAGYGGRFRKWLMSDDPQPYGSWGNGSAMRVSAAGWIFYSMFDTRECARMTARPTHNHPEGIKGAISVASAIYLARKGATKEEIKKYIETEFDYNLDRTLDEIRPFYRHDGSCQGTVPEAIIAFLESEDFEDAIRNAVSLGGDADTLTCITGSIAEAFYGIPENLIEKCREYLPKEFLDVIDKFNSCKGYLLDDLENYSLENKIAEYNKNPSEKNLQIVHEEILNMLVKNYESEELIGFFTLNDVKIADDGREVHYLEYFEKDNSDYEVFYTNIAEMLKSKKFSAISEAGIVEIKEIFRIFEEVYNCEDYNLVINPYGENPFLLRNDALCEILKAFHHKIRQEVQKGHVKFMKKHLSNDFLIKDFFAKARFIHIATSGAMGDPGVLEIWTKNFEHYYCHWTDGFDFEKFHAAFMKDKDMPHFNKPVKNGWCFHYMGYGNNFYIKEELNAEYVEKYETGLKSGAHYPYGVGVFPVEEIMLELLAESESAEDDLKNFAVDMENAINKFEMQDNVITYRRADIALLDYFEKVLQSGGIIQDDGFITTTLLKVGSTENELEICIIVPKGIGYGAYIAPMSIAPEECEFILNRGTFFKVRKVDRENSQVVIEVVGRSPKELD